MLHGHAIAAAAAAASVTPLITLLLPFLPAATATATLPPYLNASAPSQTPLFVAASTNVSLPGRPNDIVFVTSSVAIGVLIDVAVDAAKPRSTTKTSLFVLDTTASPPRLSHVVPLPSAVDGFESGPIALSRDGTTLFLPIGPGALVVDVRAVLEGPASADHVVPQVLESTTASAIGVTLSSDERFVFVSEEYGHDDADIAARYQPSSLQVYGLSSSSSSSSSSTVSSSNSSSSGGPPTSCRDVGYMELPGLIVASSVLNKAGTKLYVVTQVASDTIHAPSLAHVRGTLSVIDVETLVRDPALAKQTMKTVHSGAGSARLLPSADGEVIWVTCRESNRLLAFDTETLEEEAGPSDGDGDGEGEDEDEDALLASVQVGTNPLDMVFLDDERYILTADTNRHDSPDASTGLTVVNVDAALGGQETGFLRIPTARSPRAFALGGQQQQGSRSSKGKGALLLVAQYESMEVNVFNADDVVAAADGEYAAAAEQQDIYETWMGKSDAQKKKKKKKKKKTKKVKEDKDNNNTDNDTSAASFEGTRASAGMMRTWLFGGLVVALLVFML